MIWKSSHYFDKGVPSYGNDKERGFFHEHSFLKVNLIKTHDLEIKLGMISKLIIGVRLYLRQG